MKQNNLRKVEFRDFDLSESSIRKILEACCEISTISSSPNELFKGTDFFESEDNVELLDRFVRK